MPRVTMTTTAIGWKTENNGYVIVGYEIGNREKLRILQQFSDNRVV